MSTNIDDSRAQIIKIGIANPNWCTINHKPGYPFAEFSGIIDDYNVIEAELSEIESDNNMISQTLSATISKIYNKYLISMANQPAVIIIYYSNGMSKIIGCCGSYPILKVGTGNLIASITINIERNAPHYAPLVHFTT